MNETKKLTEIFNEKGNKGAEEASELIVKNEKLLPDLLKLTGHMNARVRFAAFKTMMVLSGTKPMLLFPHFDFFIKLFDHKNNIFRWIALDIIGNLSFIDHENKIDRQVIDRYFNFLGDESMITAAYAIANLQKFVKSKPRFSDEIVRRLLLSDRIERNSECRNILAGHTINAFSKIFQHIKNNREVELFVQRQLLNTRPGTRKKAEKFLKKYGKTEK